MELTLLINKLVQTGIMSAICFGFFIIETESGVTLGEELLSLAESTVATYI